VNFEEQTHVMSRDKCSNIFSRQMEATVFVSHHLQNVFATSTVLKIGEYYSDLQSREAIRPIAGAKIFHGL